MIGWVPRSTDRSVASFRYRCLLPMSELRRRGLAAELFEPSQRTRYRAVIFSKRYDSASRDLARQLVSNGTQVVLDLCDNHFYNPYGLPAYQHAASDLRAMVAVASRVVCSTTYLAEIVAAECGAHPVVIPDPIEDVGVPAGDEPTERTIVWFGSHGSPNAPGGMADIANVAEQLTTAASMCPFKLEVISNSREKFERVIAPLHLNAAFLDWSPATQARALARAAGAIVPIDRNPFTLAKSNNRLVTALVAGVPVIADSIPAYDEFRPFCYLDDWENGLRNALLRADDARHRTEAGARYARSRYSLARIGEAWAEFLSELPQGTTRASAGIRGATR